jgi:hypothetical protein
MNEKFEIDPNKMIKIRRKLLDIGIAKIGLNMPPHLGIPEFKHIICSYKLPKKSWWQISKILEKNGFIKTQGKYGISININQSMQMSSEMRMAMLYLNNLDNGLNNSDTSPGIPYTHFSKRGLVSQNKRKLL